MYVVVIHPNSSPNTHVPQSLTFQLPLPDCLLFPHDTQLPLSALTRFY